MAAKKKAYSAKGEFVVVNNEPAPSVIVKGTDIGDGWFAYNSGNTFTGWKISDIKSGSLLQCHFTSLAETKAFMADMSDELKTKIADRRKSAEYKKMCEDAAKTAESLGSTEAAARIADLNYDN